MTTTHYTLGHHYLKSALSLAHAAYSAYEENSETYDGFENFRFDEVVPFASEKTKDNEATRGFLAAREDAIVLAFRGTDMTEIQDWAINLNFVQIRDNGAFVHQGFVLALASVWNKIDAPLRQMLEKKNRKVWVTGHSLGGALATLATRRLLNMKLGQIETHTFGQPFVGDKTMGRQITSPFYRFAYASDPVTVVPLKIPKRLDYTHAGTLKQIDATGHIHEDASNWLSHVASFFHSASQIKKDFLGNDLKTFFLERIKDHFMPNYVEKIAQAIKKG